MKTLNPKKSRLIYPVLLPGEAAAETLDRNRQIVPYILVSEKITLTATVPQADISLRIPAGYFFVAREIRSAKIGAEFPGVSISMRNTATTKKRMGTDTPAPLLTSVVSSSYATSQGIQTTSTVKLEYTVPNNGNILLHISLDGAPAANIIVQYAVVGDLIPAQALKMWGEK